MQLKDRLILFKKFQIHAYFIMISISYFFFKERVLKYMDFKASAGPAR